MDKQGMAAMLDSIEPEELTAYIREDDNPSGQSDAELDSLEALEAEQNAAAAKGTPPAAPQQAKTPQGTPTTPAPLPPKFKEPSELDLIKAQLAELTSAQQPQVQEQPQPQPQPAPKPAAPVADPLNPNFNFNPALIPDQLLAGLASPDPMQQKAAVAGLLQTAVTIAFNSARAAMEHHTKSQFDAYRQEVESYNSTLTRAQQITHEFQTEYPMLNNPLGNSLAVQLAPTVMKNLGVKTWSTPVRDALAAAVYRRMKELGHKFEDEQQQQQSDEMPSFGSGGNGAGGRRTHQQNEFSGLFDGLELRPTVN